MALSKHVIKFFSGIWYGICSKVRMHFTLILDLIFILLNLFCLIFLVIITIIISIPHYKAAAFSFLTPCLHWLMMVKLPLQLFIKFRTLRTNGTCSPHYMHYSTTKTNFLEWMSIPILLPVSFPESSQNRLISLLGSQYKKIQPLPLFQSAETIVWSSREWRTRDKYSLASLAQIVHWMLLMTKTQ
jgi:hypothetical protein